MNLIVPAAVAAILFQALHAVAFVSLKGRKELVFRIPYSTEPQEKASINVSDSSNSWIESPVLERVYPELLRHVEEYGHPNIPLGSPAGKNCLTLRRLHTQKKLTETESDMLTKMGFAWHSFEDVYRTANFDEMMERLMKYAAEHDGDVSPPKKYPNDPELGAWVTGIRRVGAENLDSAENVERLEKNGFLWKSPRKCGSAFMQQYAEILQRCEEDGGANKERVLSEEDVQKWVQAQRAAAKRGAMSNTRQLYMEKLVGPNWQLQDN